MNDKLDITLRIADTSMSLKINRSEEELLRKVAKEVNTVYDAYRSRFASSSPQEVLAKVTLLFARGYVSAMEQNQRIDDELSLFESELDRLLLDNSISEENSHS